jgi:hypothetical protein
MAARVTILKTTTRLAVDRGAGESREAPPVRYVDADDAPLALLMTADPDQLPGRGRDCG